MLVMFMSVSALVFAKNTEKVVANTTKKEVIRVGTNATHPPFTFMDEKSHKIVGHDVELIKKVLTNLGYEVVFEDMKFDGLIPAVMINKIDVIACALSVNSDRAKRVSFTDGYYNGGSRIAVLKKNKTINSLEDLKDKTVGVELGTVQAKFAYDNADKLGKIVEYNSEEVFLALKTGKVDATISDAAIASYLFNSSKVVDAKFVGESVDVKAMAFAVNKKNTKLLREINEELAKLKKNGWYDQNYKKWIGEK